MGRPALDRPMSLEEYLAFENASPLKHEYVAGHVYLMPGATRRHNQICGNVFVPLRAAARAAKCRVAIEAVKLVARGVVYYPDLMVACGREPDDPHIETSPRLVVEVLSPSTERTDRREKLMVYKEIASLETYLIVHQDQRLVERHWRSGGGAWRHAVIEGDGTVPLLVANAELALDDIYDDVVLPSPEQRLRLREAAEAYG